MVAGRMVPQQPRDLVIVGAGGMGREIWEMVGAINRTGAHPQWVSRGFLAVDEPDAKKLARLGATYLGSPDDPEVIAEVTGASFIVAIGSSTTRRRVYLKMTAAGLTPATLVAPGTFIGHDVTIGLGSVISGQTSITTNVRIGEGVQMNLLCSISHDVRIDDFATLSPGVTLAGAVTVHSGAFLGARATVIPNVVIGARAIVGAGAVVIRDVPPDATVVGVPARAI